MTKTSIIHFTIQPCSLGLVLIAFSQKGVCAIFFAENHDPLIDALHTRFPRTNFSEETRTYEQQIKNILAFIEAPTTPLNIPLDIQGTAFQQRVWQALQAIPAGRTASYSDIAQRIGAPKAVRAVAGACAANKLAVVIPCHRIVKNDGAISGYRWGVARKQLLLAREKSEA